MYLSKIHSKTSSISSEYIRRGKDSSFLAHIDRKKKLAIVSERVLNGSMVTVKVRFAAAFDVHDHQIASSMGYF